MTASNSIFDHPTKGIYRYCFGGNTLAAETATARGFDGSPNFGRFLYSRPVRQVLMQVGTRYELRPTINGFEFQYRNVNEAIFGPYDYFRATGDHGENTNLLIQELVPVPGLNAKAKVTLTMELTGSNTHKFKDLCKKHYFEVSFNEGAAQLLGYRSEYDSSPSISIPLKLLANPNSEMPMAEASGDTSSEEQAENAAAVPSSGG